MESNERRWARSICNDFRVINAYRKLLDEKTTALNAVNPASGRDQLCLRLKYERIECFQYTRKNKIIVVPFSDDVEAQSSELFEKVDVNAPCNETVSNLSLLLSLPTLSIYIYLL